MAVPWKTYLRKNSIDRTYHSSDFLLEQSGGGDYTLASLDTQRVKAVQWFPGWAALRELSVAVKGKRVYYRGRELIAGDWIVLADTEVWVLPPVKFHQCFELENLLAAKPPRDKPMARTLGEMDKSFVRASFRQRARRK